MTYLLCIDSMIVRLDNSIFSAIINPQVCYFLFPSLNSIVWHENSLPGRRYGGTLPGFEPEDCAKDHFLPLLYLGFFICQAKYLA